MKKNKQLSFKIIVFFSLITSILSCNFNKQNIVNQIFIDSLLNNIALSMNEKLILGDLNFWQKRYEGTTESYANSQKYAAALISRFHLYGDIYDIKKADSLLNNLNIENRQTEAGIFRNLATNDLLNHRFNEANKHISKALAIGSEKYASQLQAFDVAFELGKYPIASSLLLTLKKSNEYGYFFRLAKYQHYLGDLEKATKSMEKAVDLAGSGVYLQQAALSNLADLYAHNGEFEKANELYMKSLRLDVADYHSLAALGSIAFINDRNSVLAKRIFDFVKSKTKSPDILLKYIALAQYEKDDIKLKAFATQFEKIVSQPIYGNMYNKYLIDLYGNSLNKPQKMLQLAEKELVNRNTPQTQAWYSYALQLNGQKELALQNYQKNISGKPLEGLELYYMAKTMEANNKKYNAKVFYKAAHKNRYDLDPVKREELNNY